MKEYLIILVGAVLVNNYVLAKFLGICPFLGVSKKLDSAFGMSVAVIFVMALATAVTWPIYTYILVPKGLSYLQTIVFILIIAALVQFVEIALKKYIPALHKALGIYLPLITTNCAVLGRDHPQPRRGVYLRPVAGQRGSVPAWASCSPWCSSQACVPAWTPRPAARQGVPGNPDHTGRGGDLLGELYGLQRHRRRPV